jgi:hypothetical protein
MRININSMFFCLDELGLGLSPPELNWVYGSYRQLVGLLGWGISQAQGQHKEGTRIYFHVSSGIQTHNPSVAASEDNLLC